MNSPTGVQFADLAQKFNLKLIVQFGSSVTGQLQHADSDVDIAVLGQQALAFERRIELMSQLASLFGVDESLIDIVDLRIANALLMVMVVTKGLVRFDADGQQFNELYVRAMKQYIDEADLHEFEHQYVQRKVGSNG